MTFTTRRIGAVAAAAAVVITLIWYVALFRPQSAHLKAAHAAYDQAAAQILQLDTQVATLQALERQIPADKTKLAALTTALPQSSDLQDALNQLHALATGTGVQLTAVNPSGDTGPTGSQTAGGVKAIKLSLSLTGPYPPMMAFISGLDSMTRTVVVDSASFSPAADGTLTTSLTTRIFYAP